MAKVKIEPCKRKVRNNAGKRVPCGTPVEVGAACINKDKHLNVMVTGMCLHQVACEGKKPKAPLSGKPMRTCHMWTTCPCSCHDEMSEMFAMAEMPRILVENPEYKAPVSEFWMPTTEEIIANRLLSSAPRAASADTVESDVVTSPDPVAATAARTFAPTESGRAARGELEQRIDAVVRDWEEAGSPGICTPAYISQQITKRYETPKPTSVGAIDAVFKRWVDIGYAVVEKKPTRLTSLTEEGRKRGYLVLRAEVKNGVRRIQSDRAKGMRV